MHREHSLSHSLSMEPDQETIPSASVAETEGQDAETLTADEVLFDGHGEEEVADVAKDLSSMRARKRTKTGCLSKHDRGEW